VVDWVISGMRVRENVRGGRAAVGCKATTLNSTAGADDYLTEKWTES